MSAIVEHALAQSMTPFGGYARYYDLLYRGKDYGAEVGYVLSLLRQFVPNARTLLDLGCGTGIHAVAFARAGYEVVGVDRSGEMLAHAREKQNPLDLGDAGSMRFLQSDIRTVALSRKFDAVVALFHVISYLPANDDLEATFARVREHLNPGGLFIFDFWYGPAVLATRPERRAKVFEDDELKIVRTATPTMHVNDNLVDVDYDIRITDKVSGRCEQLNETHRMRYLFKPELDSLFFRHGLFPVAFAEWLSEKVPDDSSWNVVLVAQAKS